MIESPANVHVKRIRSLAADRKDRRRERLFVLEEVRLVADALAHGSSLDLALYAPEQLDPTAAGRSLREQLDQLPHTHPATPQVVAAASDTVHPQGVVALVRWPAVEPGEPGIVLVLDAIQDPGNLGTLLRSAEAIGLSDEARELARNLIGIPMYGRAESLNAAVAGSVILFEALRQRTRGRS